jgi:hypothetical protein
MAIAYEGVCLGAYWNSDYIASVLRKSAGAGTIAILRWLKVPILSDPIIEPMKRFGRHLLLYS